MSSYELFFREEGIRRLEMQVRVLYFGRLKELSGASEEAVELREGSRIEDLFNSCAATRPELRKFRASLVAARNQEFAAWDTQLRAGDEVGFLPPVSGG
jgi:molybdopterin converting factor subunit 1